jgi:hypothetical protein
MLAPFAARRAAIEPCGARVFLNSDQSWPETPIRSLDLVRATDGRPVPTPRTDEIVGSKRARGPMTERR